jgi:hypothetical protein
LVETESQTLGSLSRYLHDVLMTCGTGPWLQQLQQRMPPRPVEDSLRALVILGLIECFEPEELPLGAPTPRHSGMPGMARSAFA